MSVVPVKSSYRDRTLEFLSVAERLKKSFSSPNNAAASSGKPDSTRSAVAIQSEFNKRASKIGFGIHQTSQKLFKLAKREFSFHVCLIVIFSDMDIAASVVVVVCYQVYYLMY